MENKKIKNILLVDDDPQSLHSTKRILELAGYRVSTAQDGVEAFELSRPLADGRFPPFEMVISDVRMPRMNGIELLKALSLSRSELPVVLMTAFGEVDEAVQAMKLGAVDFLIKPFKRRALLNAVSAAVARTEQKQSPTSVYDREENQNSLDKILGRSQTIQRVRELVYRVAETEATVLIFGESGTGKELVANTIHSLSARSKKQFVALNCAAIPEQLMESELFGYEKGAFSGAVHNKKGLFEQANGGTLFLDEIGDMPLTLQSKLLRVLQEGKVRRLGGLSEIEVDVRVISATHRNLREFVADKRFREDLLFRLEVVMIRLPPLRERKEDISLIAEHFLSIFSKRYGRNTKKFSNEATDSLIAHSWPGNVRELSNVVERAVVFGKDQWIELASLPDHIQKGVYQKPENLLTKQSSSFSIPIGTPLREIEDLLILKTLEATQGDKAMTAKLLGINSRTIYRRLEKLSDR